MISSFGFWSAFTLFWLGFSKNRLGYSRITWLKLTFWMVWIPWIFQAPLLLEIVNRELWGFFCRILLGFLGLFRTFQVLEIFRDLSHHKLIPFLVLPCNFSIPILPQFPTSQFSDYASQSVSHLFWSFEIQDWSFFDFGFSELLGHLKFWSFPWSNLLGHLEFHVFPNTSLPLRQIHSTSWTFWSIFNFGMIGHPWDFWFSGNIRYPWNFGNFEIFETFLAFLDFRFFLPGIMDSLRIIGHF